MLLALCVGLATLLPQLVKPWVWSTSSTSKRLLVPSLQGGHGCHVLGTEQLQAKPPAEAHRILHSGTEAGEETSFHHTVKLGWSAAARCGAGTPDFAHLPKTGGRRLGGQCLHRSSLEDLFSKGQMPSCFWKMGSSLYGLIFAERTSL